MLENMSAHGASQIKISNAQQAKMAYKYRNLKEKVLRYTGVPSWLHVGASQIKIIQYTA
jgi:hypothetical protein